MKGIFISQAILNKNNGGGQLNNNLIGLLKSLIGKENLTVVSLPSEFDASKYKSQEDNLIIFDAKPGNKEKIYNIIHGCPRYVSPQIFNAVFDILQKENYDFIFVGFSTYGYLIKKIKKHLKIPVLVMYQAVTPNKKNLKLSNVSLGKKIISILSYLFVSYRERLTAKLADCNIVLNQRDGEVFHYYYKKEPEIYLPIFLVDKLENKIHKNPGYQGFSLLFVGSNFGPNISGLKWFTENVMNKIPNDVNLYVVGQGMEVLRKEKIYQAKNIQIIGEIEELAPWYYYADLVVEPIFEGDGMKTKTAEAMMYGKTILGTDETFCGYVGLDDYLCNTAEEFIEKILYFKKNNAHHIDYKIREIYLNYYSQNTALKTLSEALEKYVKNK